MLIYYFSSQQECPLLNKLHLLTDIESCHSLAHIKSRAYCIHNLPTISANADGPRDAASRPIDHIALHAVTQVDVKCIHQATAFVDIDSTCNTDRQLPAFSTHVHDEAQTPLVQFVVDVFYKKFATNPQQIEPVEFEP